MKATLKQSAGCVAVLALSACGTLDGPTPAYYSSPRAMIYERPFYAPPRVVVREVPARPVIVERVTVVPNPVVVDGVIVKEKTVVKRVKDKDRDDDDDRGKGKKSKGKHKDKDD